MQCCTPNCTHLMEIGTVPPVLFICCVKNRFFFFWRLSSWNIWCEPLLSNEQIAAAALIGRESSQQSSRKEAGWGVSSLMNEVYSWNAFSPILNTVTHSPSEPFEPWEREGSILKLPVLHHLHLHCSADKVCVSIFSPVQQTSFKSIIQASNSYVVSWIINQPCLAVITVSQVEFFKKMFFYLQTKLWKWGECWGQSSVSNFCMLHRYCQTMSNASKLGKITCEPDAGTASSTAR